MRLKKLITIMFFVCIFMYSNNALSQLKVKGATSKVIIGPDRMDSDEDPLSVLSLSIFGREDSHGSGAKLAFGDFGSYSRMGWNVFIGEYSNYDSDKLWLHGKNGFYLTYANGDTDFNIMSFDVNRDSNLYIHTDAVINGVKFPLNRTLFPHVFTIHNSYEKLINLKCLTYSDNSLKNNSLSIQSDTIIAQQPIYDSIVTQSESQYDVYDDKYNNDIEFFSDWSKNVYSQPKQRNSFDIEQFKKLFPELIEFDSVGTAYIDYIGLIPILVNAIQEQSDILKAQNLKIKELQSNADSIANLSFTSYISDTTLTKSSYVNDSSSNLSNAFLYQNTPNPFNETTIIKYFLPENTINAYIYILDLQGAMLMSYKLTQNGFGQISINASELNAGMYLYSLVIDNNIVETKRMMLTK